MSNTEKNTDLTPVFKNSFFLTAGECNARGEMPMTLIAERIIEVATNHANHLGIGYANLSPFGIGWVLSRLGVNFERIPKINQHYVIYTWIESWNRLFSERCFKFTDENGQLYGWGRTVWATIDFKTRRVADLTQFATENMIAQGIDCQMPRMRKHPTVTPTEVETLTFRFMDLDFNRHVNSVRYIEHILNLWPLSHYDKYGINRFEIAYHHECLADQTVKINVNKSDPQNALVDIVRDEERVVSSAIHFIENTPSI